jgi:hypothetical protein
MEIWQILQSKGYVITNKRVLGDPLYTIKETKDKDLIQEYALVIEWLRLKHKIWITIKHIPTGQVFGYQISGKWNDETSGILKSYDFVHYDTPQEATLAAIDYVLQNLIK